MAQRRLLGRLRGLEDLAICASVRGKNSPILQAKVLRFTPFDPATKTSEVLGRVDGFDQDEAESKRDGFFPCTPCQYAPPPRSPNHRISRGAFACAIAE